MNTISIKTSALIGPALDWAAAKCEGRRIEFNYQYTEEIRFDGWWQLGPNHWQLLNSYSTNWTQGGPIIERELIRVIAPTMRGIDWIARIKQGLPSSMHGWFEKTGPTPLIAAMRCYVASELGDTVEIPKELIP